MFSVFLSNFFSILYLQDLYKADIMMQKLSITDNGIDWDINNLRNDFKIAFYKIDK